VFGRLLTHPSWSCRFCFARLGPFAAAGEAVCVEVFVRRCVCMRTCAPCAANLAAMCYFFERDSKLFVNVRGWVVGIDPDLRVDRDTKLKEY